MNDRGVRLGPTDLLKSFLLSNITEPAGVDIRWRQMVSELAGVDVNAPSEFIKTFLIARYADVSEGSSDVERIKGLFHTWVKDNASRIGLNKPSDYSKFIFELVEYSDYYRTVALASRKYHAELKGIFFNAYNGITAQAAPILAALQPGEDSVVFKIKSGLIADYLDFVYTRRLVNDLPSFGDHLDREAVRLVGPLRDGVSMDRLRTILAGEAASLDYDFRAIATYGLRSNNSRQVRYLLARITGFVEVSCERADEVARYLDAQRPFEIEHIWANHFDRYQPETGTRTQFDSYRNRLGALLLLAKSDNASYQDLPYERKVEFYQRQNNLAASLHAKHRERNPAFNRFVKESRLDAKFRAFLKFDKAAIRVRQELYHRLCDLIWDPAMFGPLPPASVGRPDRARARTRARYDVAVADLVSKGLIPASAKLIGRRRGELFEAAVVEDGRIRVASGETFGSLSAAGEFVLQTKACPGWNFWHTEVDGQEMRLLNIRRDGLEKGIL